MKTITVTNPNTKLVFYFGKPIAVKKHGAKVDGWQPTLVTFALPPDWAAVVPPEPGTFAGELIHARGPRGATVNTSESGMTNLSTP